MQSRGLENRKIIGSRRNEEPVGEKSPDDNSRSD